ncbi:putative ferric-chelate reductase 1 [Anarrhichthys ocellatus]|uniref:putative ferric-chelate reductase 1 n=1 Tax=Anarrhichthys ocellatus TaxID=433405 RepID=UPI0012EE8441|nr:putative ferric-chelate reductase 1 [Anarrhichthys ocellatus]
MDNRLVLTVLFVTLSWMSAGNCVQAAGNTTIAANVTTPAANITSATNVTTPAANITSATNVTTAAGNNTTAAPTTGPPLTTNTTVETLETPVSRTGCGSQRLCGTQPTGCDPSANNSCFFASFKQRGNSRNFEIEVSGESDGYVACTLSRDSTLGGNDTTYVCANNNGAVEFFGALLNNNQLTKTTLNVNSVKGKVNGRKIQCTFAATAPPPLVTRAGESFAIGISTGPFTNGTLGTSTSRFLSPLVDVSNSNGTAINTLNANTTTTTASPNTTSHGITLRQSLTQAVLMTVGVLSLAML